MQGLALHPAVHCIHRPEWVDEELVLGVGRHVMKKPRVSGA